MRRKVDRSLLTGAAGLGVFAVTMGVLPGIPSANQQRELTVKAASSPKADEGARLIVTEQPAAKPAPPSFDRYRRLLERNPFAPRLPKKPPVLASPPPVLVTPPVLPPVEKPAEAKKPETAPPAASVKPPETPDPLKDWVYSGTVAIGGDVYAVVENKASKQGRYLKAGEELQGAIVESVTQTELGLTLNGAPRTLPKSSAFNVTPLNAGGGGGPQPNPGGAGPGQPGGAPPGGPMPAGGPAPAGPGGAPVIRRPGPVPASAPSPAPTLSAPTSK